MIQSPLHERIARHLERVHGRVHQTVDYLSAVQAANQVHQQRIGQVQARLQQLLAKVKPPAGPTDGQRDEQIHPRPPAHHSPPDEVEQLLRQSAHDLKTNFSLIQAAAYLLVQAATHTDRQQMLGMLERNFGQATRLITQLLDVTRLEAGEEQRQLSRFDVVELVQGLVEHIRPLAQQKGLWVVQQGVGSLQIEGDWVKLYRIAHNLLFNALTYTQGGGVTVGLAGDQTSPQWRLSITDTGPGLSSDNPGSSGRVSAC